MNAKEKAKQYASGKSSSEVFRKAHEEDYLAGYNEGIKALYVLNQLHLLLEEHQPIWYLRGHHNEIVKLNNECK